MIKLPARVLEAGTDIFSFEIRKFLEDFVLAQAGREKVKHIHDANSHSANTGPAPALFRIDGNPILLLADPLHNIPILAHATVEHLRRALSDWAFDLEAGSRVNENVLVGIVGTKRDLQILQEQSWYRIPMSSVRKGDRWPPGWFAAYETQAVSGGPQQVLHYARVLRIEPKTREELFPDEPAGGRAGKPYHQLQLGPLHELPAPLVARRPRRNPFIHTTYRKLLDARDLNDLFDDSSYENELWNALKAEQIPAERQWHAIVDRRRYILDFAVFCRDDDIDVEVDGPRHHHIPSQSEYDSDRNNELTTRGWDVLRFTTRRVRSKIGSCLAEIARTIERNGGPDDATIVPRRFVATPFGLATQLALFEQRADYDRLPR